MRREFKSLLHWQKSLAPGELCLINKNNTHLTENVAAADNDLSTLIGFCGSAGTLSLTAEEIVLWVDGRYLGIAERQYRDTPVQMFSRGGETQLGDYLKRILSTSARDGVRVHKVYLDLEKWSSQQFREWREAYPAVEWLPRKFQVETAAKWSTVLTLLEDQLCGASSEQKLAQVQRRLGVAQVLLLANPEDIAWVLNLRAHHFPFSRAVRARALITRTSALLFWDEDPARSARLSLARPGWTQFDGEMKWLHSLQRLLREKPDLEILVEEHARPGALNAKTMLKLESTCGQRLKKIERTPVELMRMVKNDVEIERLRVHGSKLSEVMSLSIELMQQAIEREGWISERALGLAIDRIAKQLGARGSSFAAITGSGPNGALPHHQWARGKSIVPGDMVVLDIGYYFAEGDFATDMTRTVLAGRNAKPKPLQREIYTLVLRAFLRQFFVHARPGTLKACELDRLGRSLLTRAETLGFKFLHGTGHGLGINDHELALTISPKSRVTLRAGYCYSIEPGLYALRESVEEKDAFGVRFEDIVVLQQHQGWLMHTSTAPCPFDERLIDFDQLDLESRERYARYLELCPQVRV